MIPIYLEMKAFGPYACQEIVDFRELGDHKLFLPTTLFSLYFCI